MMSASSTGCWHKLWNAGTVETELASALIQRTVMRWLDLKTAPCAALCWTLSYLQQSSRFICEHDSL
jgi:hypothetical protein